MNDLIYRDGVIEALTELHNNVDVWEVKVGISEAIHAINKLPSAEAVHKPDYSYEAGMVKRLRQAEAEQVTGKLKNPCDSLLTCGSDTCKESGSKLESAEAVQGETVQVKQVRKKIYIAGPVTGVEGYEETFAKAADDLRARGYEPVNPVAPGLVEGWTYRDYINRGFQMLMECDGMLLLPGYMDSKGAALELHYALAVGMEIIKGCDYGEN